MDKPHGKNNIRYDLQQDITLLVQWKRIDRWTKENIYLNETGTAIAQNLLE